MLVNYHHSEQDRFIPQRKYSKLIDINSSIAYVKQTSASNYNSLIRKQLFSNENDKANIFYQNQA